MMVPMDLCYQGSRKFMGCTSFSCVWWILVDVFIQVGYAVVSLIFVFACVVSMHEPPS